MATSFKTVQQYLNNIMSQWVMQHHREPDLPGAHSDPGMGWTTKQQLASSAPFGMQLIAPGTPGNQTNLYLALTEGVPGFPRMPFDGPYMTSQQTDYIAQWIDDGMPD